MSDYRQPDTYRAVDPKLYSYQYPVGRIPERDGWEKIGYTEQESAATRIKQQATELGIPKEILWEQTARFIDGGFFKDDEFHRYLQQQGVERAAKETTGGGKRPEWFHLQTAPHASLDYYQSFVKHDYPPVSSTDSSDYVLRDEQQDAVEMALRAFNGGVKEILWNAKPRFGKSLATYELARRLDATTVLIVTNRPAIANSWFDDYQKFIAHQTTYQFVSDSPSLKDRHPMSRQQWDKFEAPDKRLIEFLSLQDLKGSQYFGGTHDKLKHIKDEKVSFTWDLLVIDEAHEGVDTIKTDVALEQISARHILHLSGTPFRALAQGKFPDEAVFHWTYEDECEARANWDNPEAVKARADEGREYEENPYESLPRLNLLTYQMSRMIVDDLSRGAAAAENSEDLDFAFNLGEFFATKPNGDFEHEAEVRKFLDRLTSNAQYPFSTKALRDENRHTFWLLNRVSSVKALDKMLADHPAFEQYKVVIAAGDGKTDDDEKSVGQSLQRVREAIKEAEAKGTRTITLSVGQLTTGVTIPEWTAVVMLANLSSASQYMQAAFRAQNPHTYVRDGKMVTKQNAYVYDFAPERTLEVYEKFATNLGQTKDSGEDEPKQEAIKRLLNFFPVIGEDAQGQMIELDAAQVLQFPRANKAREVVRKGFMCNLLFEHVGGIFRYAAQLAPILNKMPAVKPGRTIGETVEFSAPEKPITQDEQGNVVPDEIVVNSQVKKFAPERIDFEYPDRIDVDLDVAALGRQVKAVVTTVRAEAAGAYQAKSRDAAAVSREVAEFVSDAERARLSHRSELASLTSNLEAETAQAERAAITARIEQAKERFDGEIKELISYTFETAVPNLVRDEETRRETKRADAEIDKARAHLRGFARTIPMFLMAYGDANMRLANFDDYTDDDVFTEVTGITEAEFRLLRDGQTITEDDGTETVIPGLFDEVVFDQSIVEFLAKKAELADYFDESLLEDIFDYIPRQKPSLVFTPRDAVEMMVDTLETENPGIFTGSTTTFADLFSKAGVFIMELVRRLDKGLAEQIPDPDERLKHILTTQVFTLSPSEILRLITIEAVSGGIPERKAWLEGSGHFRVGDFRELPTDWLSQAVQRPTVETTEPNNKDTMKKFDVVIGNPPYHEDTGTRMKNQIYHRFVMKANEVAQRVVMIHPAGWVKGGIRLNVAKSRWAKDQNLRSIMLREDDVFPGASTGSVTITSFDNTGEKYPEPDLTVFGIDRAVKFVGKYQYEKLEFYSSHPTSLVSIVDKVRPASEDVSMTSMVSPQRNLGVGGKHFTKADKVGNPAIHHFPRGICQTKVLVSEKLLDAKTKEDFYWINGQDSYWDIKYGADLDSYKVVFKATGNKQSELNWLLLPGEAFTDKFLMIGFDNRQCATNCRKYLSTRFYRALMGTLLVDQNALRKTHRNVPTQDFTSSSDIDWSKPIPEIDQQLYKKYGLTEEEIAFIEGNVKTME
ncbi:MAG: Eco57I restriction-modification methylase domain-containing protein [Cellulomonadaceae bacterium]|nr:Eco57I restriction-modification methylase domain-containing protein [Cellulomonadaceae bacterium]